MEERKGNILIGPRGWQTCFSDEIAQKAFFQNWTVYCGGLWGLVEIMGVEQLLCTSP